MTESSLTETGTVADAVADAAAFEGCDDSGGGGGGGGGGGKPNEKADCSFVFSVALADAAGGVVGGLVLGLEFDLAMIPGGAVLMLLTSEAVAIIGVDLVPKGLPPLADVTLSASFASGAETEDKLNGMERPGFFSASFPITLLGCCSLSSTVFLKVALDERGMASTLVEIVVSFVGGGTIELLDGILVLVLPLLLLAEAFDDLGGRGYGAI